MSIKKAPGIGKIHRGKAGDFGMTTESLMPIVTHAARKRKRKVRRAGIMDFFGFEWPSGRDLLTFLGLCGFALVLLWAVGQLAILMGVA
mgnify:FL=1|nr:MAG TPA: hypothetical protein [Caudoviricetes sp.]